MIETLDFFSVGTGLDLPSIRAAGSLFTSVSNMLGNLDSSLGNIHKLITAAGYLMGVYLVTSGLLSLKHLADYRNMMSSGADLKKTFLKIIGGACLIWLPYMLQVTTMTLWGSTSPLSYSGAENSNLTYVLYRLMKVVGIIALVRGFLLLAEGSEQGQSTMGKALTHIIGGALAYNVSSVQSVMRATLLGS